MKKTKLKHVNKTKRKPKSVILTILVSAFIYFGYSYKAWIPKVVEFIRSTPLQINLLKSEGDVFLENIPDYDGKAAIQLNGNEPSFTEVSQETYTQYGQLDWLGRCTGAKALVGPETLATTERESIGMFKPSGWKTARYDDLIEDKYLYNRCHLLMFALAGNETNNERNLITGTRYMNVEGMLPYETEVLNYIRNTGNNVEYHVTPIFEDMDLVAKGVQMEALSSDGLLKFNVFVYNVQPGIEIDYTNGNSKIAE